MKFKSKNYTKMERLKESWESILIIHLSCQTLGDKNEGYSPRITSIAVMHVASATMHSFSIHLAAEIDKIPPEEIGSHYDSLEGKMLTKFYRFLQEHQNYYWIHWNMRDINFGFEAISHRFKVLTGEDAPMLPDENRICLPTLITAVYGRNYAEHPKMYNLMELNGGKHRHILNGQDEVNAFDHKQFFIMHQSTMAKVYFFKSVLEKLMRGKLVTKNSILRHRVSEFMERPGVKILGFVAVLITVFQLLYIGIQKVT